MVNIIIIKYRYVSGTVSRKPVTTFPRCCFGFTEKYLFTKFRLNPIINNRNYFSLVKLILHFIITTGYTDEM
jgi:hypothetical protein